MEKPASSSNHSPSPSPSPSPSSGGSFPFSSTNVRPSWLMTTLSELEERMKTLALNKTEESGKGDTFAERAEAYYKSRPQLLALLQDLYNGYVTLSDRYVQALSKCNHHHRKHSSQIPSVDEGFYNQEEDSISTQSESEAESSLSYQHPPANSSQNDDSMLVFNVDNLVAELVIKNVECDVLTEEVSHVERQCSESSRKIDLQKSLLEVLESERLILLNENARLGYKVASLMEENKGLASESIFMQRRAGELTRCVLKMSEDHRVFMLSRKIEDLEGQIYGLEKRNQEYYDLLTRKDQNQKEEAETTMKMTMKKKRNVIGLESCFQINKQRLKEEGSEKGNNGKKVSSFWGKVKSMDVFACGSSST